MKVLGEYLNNYSEREKNKLPQIAVFDVCNTMFYSNTTHDFVDYVFNQKFLPSKRNFYKIFNSKLNPLRYSFILISVLVGLDLYKKINVYLLKGLTHDEFSQLSKRFVAEFLQDKQINQTQLLINKCKKEKLRVILCSSSLDPIVEAIANSIEVEDFVCTTLKFKDQIFTGIISEEIADKKLQALKKKRISGEIKYAISDNEGDVSLLQIAQYPIAVIHNNKDFEFWSRYSVKTIDLRL